MIVAEKRQYLEILPQEQTREKPDRTGIQRQKQKNRKKFRAFIRVAAVFAVALLIISRFALISEQKYNFQRLQGELLELQKTNERLSLQLAQAQDIDWIEEYAVNNLGMVYPDNRDIVYIAVDSIQHEEVVSETEETDTEEKYASDGWVAALIGKVNGIFH